MKCISIFKCNPQIEVVDKSNSRLEDVPNFQNYSKSLEELFLDANHLTILNDNVFRLTKLRRLSFSDNYIKDIPPDIAKLVNLVELDCSRNKIEIIPEQIKFLRGLQVCNFSANKIEYLPNCLLQLKNLTCLTLNNCHLRRLPDEFGLLKNLESLELRENHLKSLPASITSLESLMKLDIGSNFIARLPEDIGRLTNLEYLFADENCLEIIPTNIGKLKNLQCLDFSKQDELKTLSQEGHILFSESDHYCGLKLLPEEIGGLVNLTDLHLSKNNLPGLPDGIKNLKNLSILKADSNDISSLNSNIGNCISLQELVLTSNQIKTLPSSIGSLTDLRSLNVDSNRLEELTPQIGNLKRLRILSLRDNCLTHMPSEIGQLEMVKIMDVSGNRLEYLPISITALNLKALWLSANQAQPLPKLQIDELSNGTRVLTCFLLPQQSEAMEYERQAESFDNSRDENNRQAAVSFAPAFEDPDLADGDSEVQFVRHDTPHPRDLRARHHNLLASTQQRSELRGHDNASFSMADNQQAEQSESVQDPIQTYQHLEYESNGLPEIPPVIFDQSGTRPQHSNSYHHSVNYDNSEYEREDRFAVENGVYDDSRNKTQPPVQQNLKSSYKLAERDTRETTRYILDIIVRRSKNHKPGLGLSIAGGKDTPPYKDDDEGIFVSKVTENGPAEAAGVIIGDKILSVNNNVFYEGITHQKAVDIFKKVRPDCQEFSMKILRDPNDELAKEDRIEDEYLEKENDVPEKKDNFVTSRSKLVDKSSSPLNNTTFTRTYTIPVTSETNGTGTMNNLRQFLMKDTEKPKPSSSTLPPGLSLLDSSPTKNIIYTTLVKDYKHDLGLVLENKSDDVESRSNWSNIIISQIKPNSIASRDDKLRVDDKLLSINGVDVTGIDLDRIMLMLEGTERFIRIVVSRGENDDPIGAALRNMPIRPPLGSWFSSTSNMSHRPSLIESYQRPIFGSVSSLQKQPQPLHGTKPPKPPKPTHLISKDSEASSPTQSEDNPIARPRSRGAGVSASTNQSSQISDAEKRAAWRRDRLKSIEDDVEMAKLIAEAQRRRREEN